jgi:hypothetical protein
MIKTFGDLFKYPKLSNYAGLKGKIPLRFGGVYLGLEIEMEGVTPLDRSNLPSSFLYVEDGSLKDRGIEAVTVPIKLEFIEQELQRLFASFDPVFSPRTSIHVHINMRDMSIEHVVKFTILYILFEKALYKFSGNRWDNNYCVPICQNSNNIIRMFYKIKRGGLPPYAWTKYTGINFNPLWGTPNSSDKIGTIEFRHMEGNKDIHRIIDWCNIITCLKFHAKQVKLEDLVVSLTTTKPSKIIPTIPSIFKEWTGILCNYDSFLPDFCYCLTHLKYVLYASELLTSENNFSPILP